MVKYLRLKQEIIDEMIKHAEKEFPNECAGAIILDKYIPFVNCSMEPENSFLIEDKRFYDAYLKKEVKFLVHSHNNKDYASSLDQLKHNELEIPSIILNVRDGKFSELFYLGITVPLLNRPFRFGCWDCLQLVYDYYKSKYKIKLPNPPRDIEFITNNHKFFEEYLDQLTQFQVVKIDELEEDDILFYCHAGRIFHTSIYINNDKILSHWLNQRSNYHNISYNKKYLKFGMRLKK